jgi:hypothetical protein
MGTEKVINDNYHVLSLTRCILKDICKPRLHLSIMLDTSIISHIEVRVLIAAVSKHEAGFTTRGGVDLLDLGILKMTALILCTCARRFRVRSKGSMPFFSSPSVIVVIFVVQARRG